jgi:hypothetical protein
MRLCNFIKYNAIIIETEIFFTLFSLLFPSKKTDLKKQGVPHAQTTFSLTSLHRLLSFVSSSFFQQEGFHACLS